MVDVSEGCRSVFFIFGYNCSDFLTTQLLDHGTEHSHFLEPYGKIFLSIFPHSIPAVYLF